MKLMIRKDSKGVLTGYVPKKDLEEPITAMANLAATEPRAAKFVEALWNSPIPSGQYRYYDAMWYLMGLLHCSGEF